MIFHTGDVRRNCIKIQLADISRGHSRYGQTTHKDSQEADKPVLPALEGTEKLKPTIKLKVDDGEIAVLPFIICLFSLILGDLQKEKLQIVSISRFGHKKRGLFQCPRFRGR